MKYLFFDTITSTNTYLKDNYKKFSTFTIACTKHQSEGRGRMGRKWISYDDLLFSILIKDDIINPSEISLKIANSIRKVLLEYNITSTIKWPNDIMIKDNKVCGILLEAVTVNKIECVVIGVGLNTNTTDFPSDLRVKATSLKKHLNFDIDNKELLYKIINKFYDDYYNDNDYINDINKYFYLKGKEVSFLFNNKTETGKVLRLNNDGSISIETSNNIININYGEITLNNVYKETL